jgi:hypothetical protein
MVKSYIIVNRLIGIPFSPLLFGLKVGILHGLDSRFQLFHLLLRSFQFRPAFFRCLYQGIKVSFGIRPGHLENLS